MSFDAVTDVVPMTVLRASRTDGSAAWWAEAEARAPSAPAALQVILRGRNRVELTEDEAIEALEWAKELPGWHAADPEPLIFRHQP